MLEKPPNAPRVTCGPELLEHLDSAQCLGPRLLKPILSMSKPSLQLHRASQNVCIIAVGRVQLGLFDVSVRVIDPGVLIRKVILLW